MLAIVVCLFLGLDTSVIAVTKRWVQDSSSTLSSNWENNRLPCSGDRIIMETPAMTLVESTTVREIILPMNGTLLLPPNGWLNITGDSTCSTGQGQDVKFIGGYRRYWVDPDAWNAESADTIAIPHAARIPCRGDVVEFPAQLALSVILPGVATTVGTLRINGKELSTREFKEFLGSPTGRSQFLQSKSVSINIEGACTNQTGCACDNDHADMLELICSIQGQHCPPAKCSYPIVPIGHCCDFCGAFLTVDYNQNFRISNFRTVVRNIIVDNSYDQLISHHISKTSSGSVQIVLADKSNPSMGNASRMLAHILHWKLEDLSYGVTEISLQASGEPHYHHRPLESGNAATYAILAVLAIIILMGVLAWLYKRRSDLQIQFMRFDLSNLRRLLNRSTDDGPPFAFARFDNEPRPSVQLEMGAGGQAFANPLFDAAQGKETEKEDNEDVLVRFGELNDEE